jgi:hypothetical protein
LYGLAAAGALFIDVRAPHSLEFSVCMSFAPPPPTSDIVQVERRASRPHRTRYVFT